MSVASSIEEVVEPRRLTLLGDLPVARVLPFRGGRMVGPFAYLDHMGPFTPPPDGTLGDVPPHPHIGLSTLTYLLEGQLTHRDSMGTVRTIEPGAVNWMTAGRGVVHSERVSADERRQGLCLHGLQAWVALPTEEETIAPSFEHHEPGEIPAFDKDGTSVTLIAGEAFGRRSPVRVRSQLFYMLARLPSGRVFEFEPGGAETALYLFEGELLIDGESLAAPRIAVLRTGARLSVKAAKDSAMIIFGGKPFPERRTIWWNFVSSSKERIEEAKVAWTLQKMGSIPGETQFVPLPGSRPERTTYP